MLNTKLLDAIVSSTPSFVGQTDAQVAASPIFTTPTTAPNTGPVTATTLGVLLTAPVAVQILSALNDAVAAGQASGATSAAQQLGAEAAYALLVIGGAGFNPQDPNSQGMLTAFVGGGILTQAQSDAITTLTSYRVGAIPEASDVTASRARIAAAAAVQTAWATAVGTALANAIAANPLMSKAQLKAIVAGM